MNVVDVLNASRKAAEDLMNDPQIQLDALNIEIAFKRYMMFKCAEDIVNLQDQRRELEKKIAK